MAILIGGIALDVRASVSGLISRSRQLLRRASDRDLAELRELAKGKVSAVCIPLVLRKTCARSGASPMALPCCRAPRAVCARTLQAYPHIRPFRGPRIRRGGSGRLSPADRAARRQ